MSRVRCFALVAVMLGYAGPTAAVAPTRDDAGLLAAEARCGSESAVIAIAALSALSAFTPR